MLVKVIGVSPKAEGILTATGSMLAAHQSRKSRRIGGSGVCMGRKMLASLMIVLRLLELSTYWFLIAAPALPLSRLAQEALVHLNGTNMLARLIILITSLA